MPANARKCFRLGFALFICASIASCSGWIPGLYRVPIQQGNVITVEMLQELELGMNKRKVSFILGTPLVIDAFHLDRWDYFYSYQSSGGERVQQTASLFFEQDRLTRINADIDSKIDFHTVTEASENVLIVPPRKKGGFLAAITPGFLKRDEAESKQEAIARSLSTGVNVRQPGSGTSGSTRDALDPALTSPPAAGEAAADAAAEAVAAASDTTTVDATATADAAATTPAPASPSDDATAAAGVADSVSDGAIDSAGAPIGTAPSEVYAPNTSAGIETATAGAAASATAAASRARAAPPVEVISAEVQGQSKYLQQLFDGFGSAPTTAPAPSAIPARAETDAATQSPPAEPPNPTRD